MHQEPLLDVINLRKYYEIDQGIFKPKKRIKAVEDVSFSIMKGETVSLVGESGCGKSTTGRSILRLHNITSGEIRFKGTQIDTLNERELRTLRSKMQMIFQDPYASLNPKKSIRQILTEPLRVHGLYSPKERVEKAIEILKIVGLNEYHLDRYPYEFSGGQRQRIGIARAVILQPELIVADEPVSALDLSVQSQVVNLLLRLQKDFQLTYLFISHDLGVVQHVSDRVGVMYLGRMVEMANTKEIFANPKHPYTQALLSAVPKKHPDETKERIILHGDLPSPAKPPAGCAFHPRCPYKMAICTEKVPVARNFGNNQIASCHLYNS